MALTPLRRIRAKRALEVTPAPDELDFDSVEDTAEEDPRAGGPVRSGLAALAVSALGMVVVGGVVLATGPTSQKVDTAATSTDRNHSDITRAVPAPAAMTLDQQVQARINQNKAVKQGSGGLTAFNGRSTVSRSAARTELAKAITVQVATQRETTLDDVNKIIVQTATDAGADARGDQLAIDIEKVKAEAKRIAAEKKKAEALLKKNGKAAAKAKAEGKPVPSTGGTVDVSAIISSGGGTTPMAAGHYSVGASWGQYGSWSRWHTGQDFPSPIGTPVRAVADGVVSTNCGGCQGWAGSDAIVVHHANGGSTLYAHMGSATVSSGQVVKAGQVIGYIGMKGRTFGPHLHFEYYPKGTTPGDVYSTSNPVAFLLSLGVRV